jgi:crotonobetainyl-CoA:carnitine CoA-transferase CaiB-like acyl-CoA transferase
VSVSLLRHGAYTIGFDLNTALRLGVSIGVGSRSEMGNPAINSYRDSAGAWFWLVGLEGERHWPDLARAVGRPEWLTDSRFATARARRRNARELISLLDEIFATRTTAEWASVFDAEGVWWAPVQTVDQVLADPQLHAAGGFVEVPEGPDGATTATMIATPVDFSATPWSVRSMPPEPGQHTDEILQELGLDDEAIASLRSGRVVA